MRNPKAEVGRVCRSKYLDASVAGRGARRQRLMLVGLLFGVPLAVVAQEEKPQDDDESKRRLIRKTRGESADDVMVRIIDGMARAGRRLGESFDAGDATQQLQRQILKDLDVAIQQARRNMRVRRTSAQGQGHANQPLNLDLHLPVENRELHCRQAHQKGSDQKPADQDCASPLQAI